MVYNAKDYTRLQTCVLFVSLIAWVVMFLKPSTACCCCTASLGAKFSLHNATSQATAWATMLIAMMAPMLVPPIYHLQISSFARRRVRSVTLFIVGYGTIWMVAGVVMVQAASMLVTLAPKLYLQATLIALLALIWQASPFKQRCLNKCHSHKTLAAFGTAADIGAFGMGLEHGLWCTGSCWATMLFPMLLPTGGFVAMAFVSALMFFERLDPPRTPRWRLRGFGTAFRYLVFRLRGPRCDPLPFIY